jgi:hypothetical protein
MSAILLFASKTVFLSAFRFFSGVIGFYSEKEQSWKALVVKSEHSFIYSEDFCAHENSTSASGNVFLWYIDITFSYSDGFYGIWP